MDVARSAVVWLGEAERLAGVAMSLSVAECGRARRILSDRARFEFVAGRKLLRVLLGRHLSLPPDAVRIAIETDGRPVLEGAGPDPRFSISHSSGLVAVALACGTPVGADIETVRRDADVARLAESVCSPAEWRMLDMAPDRHAAFTLIWTAKEAVAKAAGTGFRADPRRIGLTDRLAAPGQAAQRAVDATGCIYGVRTMAVAGGAILAVAMPGGCPPPRLRFAGTVMGETRQWP